MARLFVDHCHSPARRCLHSSLFLAGCWGSLHPQTGPEFIRKALSGMRRTHQNQHCRSGLPLSVATRMLHALFDTGWFCAVCRPHIPDFRSCPFSRACAAHMGFALQADVDHSLYFLIPGEQSLHAFDVFVSVLMAQISIVCQRCSHRKCTCMCRPSDILERVRELAKKEEQERKQSNLLVCAYLRTNLRARVHKHFHKIISRMQTSSNSSKK